MAPVLTVCVCAAVDGSSAPAHGAEPWRPTLDMIEELGRPAPAVPAFLPDEPPCLDPAVDFELPILLAQISTNAPPPPPPGAAPLDEPAALAPAPRPREEPAPLADAPKRLEEVEKKASERDFVAQENVGLREEVDQLRSELDTARTDSIRQNPELLKKLKQQAQLHQADEDKIVRRDEQIADLKKSIEDGQAQAATLQEAITGLDERIRALSAQNAEHEATIAGLRNTLNEYRLGRFEFYEVQTGDTAASIALNPLIYGDESKAELIRQANRTRVQDVDHLRPGEVLIIPRFPPSGKYAW